MIEVEVKLPVDSAEKIEAKLLNMGFIYKETITQEDRYYDNKDGMIRGTGQALRLRCVGNDCCITFKGRKLDSVSMTRQEFETSVGDRDVMDGILRSLGFEVVAPRVKKVRREFSVIWERMASVESKSSVKKFEMHACLDQVEDLGDFLELEIMAGENERMDALAEIERVLNRLGYKLCDTTTNSYLSMLQGIED